MNHSRSAQLPGAQSDILKLPLVLESPKPKFYIKFAVVNHKEKQASCQDEMLAVGLDTKPLTAV